MAKIRKYYHRYSFGSFLTGFALIGLVLVFGAFFIFPVFTVTKGAETLSVTGFDFLSIGMGRFIQMAFPSFPDTKDITLFTNYLTSYGGGNVLLEVVAKYYDIVFIVMSGLLSVCIPFVVIEAILAIFWLLRGRIQFPRASSAIAWIIFAFFGLSVGLAYAFMYFAGQILSAASDPASWDFGHYIPFFILGAVFAISLLVSIVHIIGYRDRKFKKREKKFDDEEDNDKNNHQKDNKSIDQEEPEPEMVQERGLPEGISEIGDHAFSKDISLTSADIPEGITVLGPSAFANCHNLKSVSIPKSVTEIGYNCFFNTGRLTKITYAGTREDWAKIIRGSNWLTNAGTVNVQTADGVISVNPKN